MLRKVWAKSLKNNIMIKTEVNFCQKISYLMESIIYILNTN